MFEELRKRTNYRFVLFLPLGVFRFCWADSSGPNDRDSLLSSQLISVRCISLTPHQRPYRWSRFQEALLILQPTMRLRKGNVPVSAASIV